MKLELTRLEVHSRGKRLAPFDLSIDASSPAFVWAIVHDDERALDSLLGILSGSLRPERGSVRVAGKDPSSTPAVRGRIATMYFQEPNVGLAERVTEHREQVKRVRQRAGALMGPLPAALVVPGNALLSELSRSERRRLALEVALGLVEPLALLLADPLRDLDATETHALLAALAHHTERRAPCIFTCTSLESATRLTPHVVELRSGGRS